MRKPTTYEPATNARVRRTSQTYSTSVKASRTPLTSAMASISAMAKQHGVEDGGRPSGNPAAMTRMITYGSDTAIRWLVEPTVACGEPVNRCTESANAGIEHAIRHAVMGDQGSGPTGVQHSSHTCEKEGHHSEIELVQALRQLLLYGARQTTRLHRGSNTDCVGGPHRRAPWRQNRTTRSCKVALFFLTVV